MSTSPATPAPLRVIHVVRPAAGGMRKHVELLAAELAARGLVVMVASPQPFGLDGCAEVRAPIPPAFNAVGDVRAVLAVARAARRARCDLLHGHGLRGALAACGASALTGLPFVFTAHNLAPPVVRFPAGQALRAVVRRACAVLCVSQSVADSLNAWGLDHGRTVIAPNGVPIPPQAPRGDRPAQLAAAGEPLVVALGRLAPEKGFDVLIRAMPLVRERASRASAVIAGEGPERAALQRLAAECGGPESVLLPGHMADVGGLLRVADVVVVPSRSEGQGLAALEAMAAGRAVVASSVGGLPETVAHGAAGILVPPDDPGALAEAVASLLGDPRRRLALGNAARARVQENYTVSAMVERVLGAYGLCARSRA